MAYPFSIKPLHVKLNLEPRIEEAFSELIHRPWGGAFSPQSWQPACDVHETEDAYLIEIDLPGVSPENVEVRIEGSKLTICGIRQSMTWTQTGQSLQIERAHGQFCRILELVHPIDVTQIEKSCVQGILHIRVPKAKSSRST